MKPVVQLADHVLIGDEYIVEEDVVGALVAHRPDPLHGDAGMVKRYQEQGDARVLGGVGVGSGAHPVPLGEVGRRGPGLLAVEDPAATGLGGLELHGRGV